MPRSLCFYLAFSLTLSFTWRELFFAKGEAQMSALRERFIEDMRIRNLAARTIESYVAGVAKLARYYERSPAAISAEEFRGFQVELLSRKVSWSPFNQTVGLAVFLAVTLDGRGGAVASVWQEAAEAAERAQPRRGAATPGGRRPGP